MKITIEEVEIPDITGYVLIANTSGGTIAQHSTDTVIETIDIASMFSRQLNIMVSNSCIPKKEKKGIRLAIAEEVAKSLLGGETPWEKEWVDFMEAKIMTGWTRNEATAKLKKVKSKLEGSRTKLYKVSEIREIL